MSDTIKHGKAGAREIPARKPRSPKQNWIVHDRRRYGSTEKILRRCASLWRKMFAKEGRKLDREAIKEGSEE